MSLTDAELGVLWRARREDSPAGRHARERLIEHFLPLVRREVIRYSAGLPRFVDRDEFLSDGAFGLIEAIDRFDETREVRFATFAEKRIRGSIVEGERHQDRASRRFRDQADLVSAAQSRLVAQLRRTPSEEELATELTVSVEQLRSLLARGLAASRPTSGDYHNRVQEGRSRDMNLEGRRAIESAFDNMPGDPGPGDTESSGWAENLRGAIAEALATVDAHSRVVLALYYFAARGCEQHTPAEPACRACREAEERGLTLQQIADLAGMSRAWASTQHSDALVHLREALSSVPEA